MRNSTKTPEGWVTSTLGDVCSTISDGTHYTPNYVDRGIPFYSVESVTNDDFTNVKYIGQREHSELIKRCRPQRGDILMTRIGSLGATKYLDWDVDASIYVSLALLRPGANVSGRYLYAYTKSQLFVKAVEDRSLLWASPKKINMGDIRQVPVLIPYEISEQNAVAERILAVEEYIATLERLIIKKQAIKQGTMQQLLTGRTRLPGFNGEWAESSLGEVSQIKTGSRNNQDKKASGQYPFFVRSATVERIDSYSYDGEAILVPGEGGIGSIFHYVDGKFEVHQRVYRISDFSPEVSGRFVYYFMQQCFGNHAMENSVKATVDSLRLPTFKNFPLRLPSFDEQESVVRVLDDAGSEIAVLKHRLSKSRDIKTGMMQQLLSGRTRLPVEAAS